jgi:hypothetical protein
MKNVIVTLFVTFILTCLASCNPECTSLGSLTIFPEFNPPGYQVVIKASPLSSLKNRKVFFGKTQAQTVFNDTMGLIVTIPEGVNGKTTLRVEDDDCIEYRDFEVVDKDNLKSIFGYVSPIIPEIIIPSLPPSYPTSIDRAWVSPINTDYCLWFGRKKDSLLIDPASKKFKYFYSLNGGSFEKTACSGGLVNDQNKIYSLNPIYGYYDTTLVTTKLFFTIDRTSRGAGLEEYVGEFIDIKKTSYNKLTFPKSGGCGKDPDVKPDMITGDKHLLLVTSKKTGRQTIVFQSSVGP